MFTIIARVILRNRILILSLLLVATAFMLYQGFSVKVSYHFSRLLPVTDSTQIDYEIFKETFDQVGNTVVLAGDNVDIFTPKNYRYWKKLESDLDTIVGVENVLSPVSSYTLVRDDSLKKLKVVLLDSISNDLESTRALYNDLPFYKGLLYSKDGKSPLMLVQIGKDYLYNKNIVRVIESIKAVIASFEEESGAQMHASGLPYIRMANTRKVTKEISLFIVMALAVTSLLLYLLLRSFRAMAISLLVVIIGVCWTFGLIASFNYTISMLSSLIPSLIIVIGVPNCIFLINKYHSEYKGHGNKVLALQRVIRKIGAATLMTNTTTALGFAAFILTDSTILKEFGVIASINILLVFFISIIVIPIFYSFAPAPKRKHYNHLDQRWLNNLMTFLTKTVKEYRPLVYISMFILIALALYGASKIYTTGNLSEEFSKSGTLYKDLKFLEKEFGGVVPLEIVIDTRRKNGVRKNSTLKKLDQLQAELAELPHLSRSLSVVDGLKFTKQAYYRGSKDFYSLPTSQERDFILSYIPGDRENLNLLRALIDSTGQLARISLQIADLGTDESKVLQAQIKEKVDVIFPPDRYDVTITGASVIFLKGTSYLIRNLIVSLLLAIFVIAIIMALLFRSFAMVIVSLLPNLFPLLMTAGIMGYFGIPLKPSTILVFSIAFGISVDDTIHFLAKYRQELRQSNWNIGRSALAAISETGVSMFYTSIILFFGFSVFIASSFGGTVSLGILVSITLIIAMFSNLLLLPSLLLSLEKLVTNRSFDEPLLTLYSEVDDEEDEVEENVQS